MSRSSLFKGASGFKTVLKWIFMLFGIIVLIWGCTFIGRDTSYIAAAPMITDGTVDPENEGEFIMASGKLGVSETLTDPLFGVTVDNSTVLLREVQMYQYYSDGGELREGLRRDVESTVRIKKPGAEKNSNNPSDYDYYNNPPMPEGFETAFFYADTTIGGGELQLGDELKKTINGDGKPFDLDKEIPRRQITDLDPDGATAYGLQYFTDGYYATPRENWQIGDIKVSFYYVDIDDLGEFSATGIQRNGVIVDGGDSETAGHIYDHEIDRAEFETQQQGNNKAALFGLCITGLGLLSVGLFCWRRKDN